MLMLRQVNLFLYIFYHFFKLIVRVSLWIFYAKTTVVNREGSSIKGSVILISNHPSTVLDPLNVAVHVPRMVHFLANASLFKTRFTNWFFNTFYCIPIERYKDTGGRPLNNAASFDKSTQFLTNGGILYIAPEGDSYVQRSIRKMKTGTARIALRTEAANDFSLGLRILPVGLNYSDPTQFRSKLVTVFGEPVSVADFQKDWEEDEVEAVKKLTLHLKDCLRGLIVDVHPEDAFAFAKLENLLDRERPLSPAEDFQRSQNLFEKWKSWKQNPSLHFQKLQFQLDKLRFQPVRPKRINVGLVVAMAVAFPFFLLGYAIHFLPCFLTQKLSMLLNDDLDWVPTYKYLIGLIIYPVVLGLEIWLVSKLPGHWPTWAFLLAIVPLGLIAEWWRNNLRALRANDHRYNLDGQKKLRAEILEML